MVGNPHLKNALRRLIKIEEFLENIVESTPGLPKNAVAVSLFMDPDLIVNFNHKETLENANSNRDIITLEMWNQATQQAVASTPAINDQTACATPQSQPAAFATSSAPQNAGAADIQRQISIMHEMDLLNDAVNLQDLQITDGDVQAAIESRLDSLGN
ncbi:hypothetical protein QAD02_017985 [Eretmocerus hayati]|uniref:Uncharacterized protein n=1 Tax=Eretmocerus hayati TaxID=131215 RepID=A0ACC2PFH8_9HYME|nr:hypothetical protein QAD02_017985 [Eretmocerus hayati]